MTPESHDGDAIKQASTGPARTSRAGRCCPDESQLPNQSTAGQEEAQLPHGKKSFPSSRAPHTSARCSTRMGRSSTRTDLWRRQRRPSRLSDRGMGGSLALLALLLLLPGLQLLCVCLEVHDNDEPHHHVADAAKAAADAKSGLASSSSSSSPSSPAAPRLECGIWLALSSLPNTGMGMYAGKEYKQGQPLQTPLGDISIPITDIKAHNSNPEFRYLWDSYVWGSDPYNPDFVVDQEAPYVEFASPGFGSLANCFLPLLNVDNHNPKWLDAGLHRSRDAGAGARTHYGDRQFTAKRDIAAGEELFVSYGEEWFKSRYEYLGPVPLTDDLVRATDLFRSHERLLRSLPGQSRAVEKAWEVFVANQALYPESRVFGAFNFSDPDEMLQLRSGKSLTEIRTVQGTRDDDWFHANGVCGDHIEVGQSTLDQAGLGGFASRDLPKGTVITTMPMVHIPDRNVFNMYRLEKGEDGTDVARTDEGVVGYQLILNYCFGHRDSTLLLCPYGPQAPYVNHNKTLANVKLAWGDPKRGNHHPEYLENPVEHLYSVYSAKIALDLVATRDIKKGEELFLDYGTEWEKAWSAHVENWRPVEGAEGYVDALKLNQNETLPFRTIYELLEDPLPDLELHCDSAYKSKRWKNFYPERIDEFHDKGEFYKCDVLQVKTDGHGNQLYTAVMWTSPPDGGKPEYKGKLKKVPRRAVRYRNRPWTSDPFLPNAFRHDIRIPDHLFPEKWKNIRTRK